MEHQLALKNPYIDFYIEDGILYGVYADSIRINVPVAKQVVKDRIEICNGKSYPALLSLTGSVILDRDAREFMGTSEGVAGMTRMAMLADSLFTKVVCNWYISLSHPLVPAKVFMDREEAIQWLKGVI